MFAYKAVHSNRNELRKRVQTWKMYATAQVVMIQGQKCDFLYSNFCYCSKTYLNLV